MYDVSLSLVAPLALLAAVLVVGAVVALAFRFNWRLGVAVVLLLLLLGAANVILITRSVGTGPITFARHTFKCTWTRDFAENAGWRLEERRRGNDGYFVLHLPKDLPADPWGLDVDLELQVGIRDRSPVLSESSHEATFDMTARWDGARLTPDPRLGKPWVSGIFLRRESVLRWTPKVEQPAPNVITMRLKLAYSPDPDKKRVAEDVTSVTVEVVPDP